MVFGDKNMCVTDGTSCGQSFWGKVTNGKNSVKFIDILDRNWFLVAQNTSFHQYTHLIRQNYSKCTVYEQNIGVTDGTGLCVTDGTGLSGLI